MNFSGLIVDTLKDGGRLSWHPRSDHAQLMTKEGKTEFVPRYEICRMLSAQLLVEDKKKGDVMTWYVLPKRMSIPTDIGVVEAIQYIRNREWRITYPWGLEHFTGAPWELRVQILREVKTHKA